MIRGVPLSAEHTTGLHADLKSAAAAQAERHEHARAWVRGDPKAIKIIAAKRIAADLEVAADLKAERSLRAIAWQKARPEVIRAGAVKRSATCAIKRAKRIDDRHAKIAARAAAAAAAILAPHDL